MAWTGLREMAPPIVARMRSVERPILRALVGNLTVTGAELEAAFAYARTLSLVFRRVMAGR